MKTPKKLYYEEENGEFYWITETLKTFLIEWVAKYNCDSDKTPLDQNVKWGNTLKVFKNKNGKHCLSNYDEEHIRIYPFQNGQLYLEPATMAHITSEIVDCIKWGVSADYYENLIQFIKQ